jgi:hypothetical protein
MDGKGETSCQKDSQNVIAAVQVLGAEWGKGRTQANSQDSHSTTISVASEKFSTAVETLTFKPQQN